jgi:hypothetical protein
MFQLFPASRHNRVQPASQAGFDHLPGRLLFNGAARYVRMSSDMQ